ncbi:MAG: restriction endonuclease subunit S, partial [Proteobacteria bacterium]|nr:restriction endonuclease subunit S [Pseudomonadota bacterium]
MRTYLHIIANLKVNKSTKCPLGELCELDIGQRLSKIDIDSAPGSYPVTCNGTKPLGYTRLWNMNNAPLGIVMSGDVGRVDWTEGRYWNGLGRCSCILKSQTEITERYLYYFLKWQKAELLHLITGHTSRYVTKKQLQRFPIIYPSLPLQKSIANFLDVLVKFKEILEEGLCEHNKWYHYYRSRLVSEQSNTEIVPYLLREVCHIHDGTSQPEKSAVKPNISGRISIKTRGDDVGEVEWLGQRRSKTKQHVICEVPGDGPALSRWLYYYLLERVT